ncbi:hypothetical protein ACTFIR_012001 [Dictyostelium discoideum]
MKILSAFQKTAKIFNNNNNKSYYLNKLFYSNNSIQTKNIQISPEENKLFDFLKNILIFNNRNDIELRVAGGWVRDKLLDNQKQQQQQQPHQPQQQQQIKDIDIDIALSNISGTNFIELIEEFKINKETFKKYLIKRNPEKSKHLETASIKIHGFQIDFNSLRSDEYSDPNSRIPEITIGTPLSDCLRRDLTINSLFYNLNTLKIEDHSGYGLSDLENSIIRTPLEPLKTLLDDPLRAFRVIRFASRFQGFQIERQLYNTIKFNLNKQLISNKVSKERIYKEFYLMMSNKSSVIQSMDYLIDTGLINSIIDFDKIINDQEIIKKLFKKSLKYLKILINQNNQNNQNNDNLFNIDFYKCCIFLPFFIDAHLGFKDNTSKTIKSLINYQFSTNTGSTLNISLLFNNLISSFLNINNTNNNDTNNNNINQLKDFKLYLNNLNDKSNLYSIFHEIKNCKAGGLQWNFPLNISIVYLLEKYPDRENEILDVLNQLTKLFSDDNFTFEKVSLLVDGRKIKNLFTNQSIDITNLMKSMTILQYENPNFKEDDILKWINKNIKNFILKI